MTGAQQWVPGLSPAVRERRFAPHDSGRPAGTRRVRRLCP